ncbi:anti-sigma factor family protein [Trichothermofontia sp.]
MTSNFDAHANPYRSATGNLSCQDYDRFELLSAYLDGEVTAAERQQVEGWLASDAEVKQLYQRLLGLRQGWQNLHIPQAETNVDQLVEQVFARVERRPTRKLVVAGAAIAAVVVGTLLSVLPEERFFSPQMASSPAPDADELVIALDSPLIELPSTIEPARPQRSPN